MTITVSEEMNASREQIWHVITDIDSWSDTISGILNIDVINKPEAGVVGLKWKETRMLYGKEAVETMWISAAEPNRFYETTAENHGMIYTTRFDLHDSNDKTNLSVEFSAKPTTVAAKIMSAMSFMFDGTVRKMLQKDLDDIRQEVEKH